MKKFFDNKKNLYYVLVVSIVTLLLGSQALVHVQIGQMNTDGELINNAGRMRMLSQRIVQQSLRIYAGEMIHEELNSTVSIFKNHINFVQKGISESLYLDHESDFNKAFSLANEMVVAGESVLADKQGAKLAITTLTKVESNFIEAQNRAVGIIQSKYESKLSYLSMLELALAIVTLFVILGEVLFIFVPLHESDSKKKEELELAVTRLKEISKTVAHDLRIPLGSISSICDLLKDEVVFKSKEDKKLFFVMGDAAETASRVASSLLSSEEEDAFGVDKVSTIELNALVEKKILTMQSSTLFKNRVIYFEKFGEPLIAVAPFRLGKVVLDLMEYYLTSSNKEITVKVLQRESSVELSLSAPDVSMSTSVIGWVNSDSPSVPTQSLSEEVERIFTYAKETVSASGGWISVSEDYKQNLTTYINFPLYKKG